MSAAALHLYDRDAQLRRWLFSAATILALHVAGAALIARFYSQIAAPGAVSPPILLDLTPTPVSVAPPSQQVDVAPGPETQQADAPPPEEAQPAQMEPIEEKLQATPLQEKAEVVAPPESKKMEVAKPAKRKPEPIKPKPVEKPKPRRSEHVGISNSKPAERTTAAPKAQRQSTAIAAPVSGASSAAAVASYNQIVAAHLQRFKQYPASSRAAGERGVARVGFTLSRSGQVMGSRLASSSGFAALDAETTAMVRRAQPFPPFPSDIKQSTMSFVVPVAFTVR